MENAIAITSFPNGNARHQAPDNETDRLEAYGTRLRSLTGQGYDLRINIGQVLEEASAVLSAGGYRELQSRVGYSKSFISKHLTLLASKARLDPHREYLPVSLNALYLLAKQSAERLQSLIDAGVIRPDLSAEELDRHINHSESASPEDEGSSSPATAGRDDVVLGVLRCPAALPTAQRKSSLEAVQQALAGKPVHLDEREIEAKADRQGLNALAREAAEQMRRRALFADTTKLGRADALFLESAIWQWLYHAQKGRFPYSATDANSIEHEKHPFSIVRFKSPDVLVRKLKEKGVLRQEVAPDSLHDLVPVTTLLLVQEYCLAVSNARQLKCWKVLQEAAEHTEGEVGEIARSWLKRLETAGFAP